MKILAALQNLFFLVDYESFVAVIIIIKLVRRQFSIKI